MKTAHKAQILPELALEDRYFSVLEEHLQGASESTLRRAYDLGRKALSDGRSLLEMATLHHIALVRILARPDSSSAEPRTLEAAYQFFDGMPGGGSCASRAKATSPSDSRCPAARV